MFKSSDVPVLLGIGKGFFLILIFSSLKSEMKRAVPSFLRIIKVEAAHLELFLRFNTPMFVYLLISVFRASSCILGI